MAEKKNRNEEAGSHNVSHGQPLTSIHLHANPGLGITVPAGQCSLKSIAGGLLFYNPSKPNNFTTSMGLFVASLNSGSNGNCYYVGNGEEGILIDAGISCRETERRMKRLELSMKKVKAIFISHEHSDHINGITGLCKKYKLPVYITTGTFQMNRFFVREDLVINFKGYEAVTIGNLTVTAFPKFHDANDPHSFIVTGNDVTVGVFTDIGRPCEHLIRHFRLCHAAILESNYDEEMLETGRYPWHLKERIRSGQGHLSNVEAVKLFNDHRPPFMSHVFPAHLSEHNNSQTLVQEMFTRVAGKTEVIIASRYHETAVFEITNLFHHDPVRQQLSPASYRAPIKKAPAKKLQLSLFD
jgi:phosphoribosyl 1,2-cyclic phosphodiesterase